MSIRWYAGIGLATILGGCAIPVRLELDIPPTPPTPVYREESSRVAEDLTLLEQRVETLAAQQPIPARPDKGGAAPEMPSSSSSTTLQDALNYIQQKGYVRQVWNSLSKEQQRTLVHKGIDLFVGYVIRSMKDAAVEKYRRTRDLFQEAYDYATR